MEGKLIKMVEGYTLSLTGSIDDLYGISDKQLAQDHQLHKLSLKNCQAIENGYDLDEVAKLSYECDPYIAEYLEQEFKRGFQKALEILGDKKFNEEDILIAIEAGYHAGVNHNVDEEEQGDKIIRLKDLVIRSLHQTEWDVEIEMERSKFISDKSLRNDIKNGFNYTPKLDTDDCLILRRI